MDLTYELVYSNKDQDSLKIIKRNYAKDVNLMRNDLTGRVNRSFRLSKPMYLRHACIRR